MKKKRVFLTDSERVAIMLKAGVKPLEEFHSKGQPWKSQCLKCSKIVQPRFHSVNRGNGGCKYCSGVAIDPSDRVQIMETANFLPLIEYPGSHKPWKSKCLKCGQISSPTLGNVISRKSSCRFCGILSRIEKQKLSTKEIRTILLICNLEQLGPYKNSKTPILCHCKICERKVSPLIGNGCPYCNKKKVDPSAAEAEMIRSGVTPLVPYPGSNRRWKSQCNKCTRLVEPTWSSVQSGQGGCAYCAGHRVDPVEAIQVMLIANLKTLVKFPGAAKRWKSRCIICQSACYPTYSNVRNGHGGCLKCAGMIVNPGEAKKTMIAAGLKPLEPYPGRHTPWKCQCLECRRQVSPRYGSVSRGGGCRFCAEIGIDYTKPGYLYLITHKDLSAHKIGIGNHKRARQYNDRLKQHSKSGWTLFRQIDFESTEDAFKVEQLTLKWLREVRHLPQYLGKKDMPQGGSSETVDASEIDLAQIWKTINRITKDLGLE